MGGLIGEAKLTVQKTSSAARQAEEDVDREMLECPAKRKARQIENFTAPLGMDRFFQWIGPGKKQNSRTWRYALYLAG